MANKVLWSVIAAGVFAQLLKILIFKFKHKQKFHINDLIVTGSMPSSHSALVTSLAISVYLTEGLSSIFILSAAFAVVVIRDAFGVRRTAGEEGKLLNELIKITKLKIPNLHYALGHKPKEVLVGAITGILVAVIITTV